MFFVIIFLVLVSAVPVQGRDKDVPDWVSAKIAEKYTPVSKETDAVLLFSDTQISYRKGVITRQEKRLYQILRLDGLDYGSLYLGLVKGTKVSDLKGYRLNASGELIEILEKENIHRTAYSEHLHDDSKQLYAHFKSIEIGDFAAYEYEIAEEPFFKTALSMFGDRIEIAFKQVRIPAEAKCVILNDPDGSVEISGTTYTTRARPALEIEENGPPLLERIPLIGIMYEPDSNLSWAGLSRQFWELTCDIPLLPDSAGQDLSALLNIRNREEFIRGTLSHVSQNVRYVSIAVGEGRFIPSPVSVVHTKKYGDCKDMAYYALAILKKGGVTAWPVLARTRDIGPVFESFPAFQFNHAIIAVELDADSIALKNAEFDGKPYLIADLTDKYTVPPMISPGLENTLILPVTPAGASLVRLPRSPSDKSVRKQAIEWTFNANRSAEVTLTETLTGHFAAQSQAATDSVQKQKKDEANRKRVQGFVPGSEMKKAEAVKTTPETVTSRYTFSAQNIGTDIDGKLYIIPNITYANAKGYTRRKRESDLVMPFYYARDMDISVDIDPAYRILSIPDAADIDNDYFSISYSANRNGNRVAVRIRFVWKTDRITPDQYPDFRKCYQQYLKAVKSQIELETM